MVIAPEEPRLLGSMPCAIRRGEGAQRKRCRDPRCSPRTHTRWKGLGRRVVPAGAIHGPSPPRRGCCLRARQTQTGAAHHGVANLHKEKGAVAQKCAQCVCTSVDMLAALIAQMWEAASSPMSVLDVCLMHSDRSWALSGGAGEGQKRFSGHRLPAW